MTGEKKLMNHQDIVMMIMIIYDILWQKYTKIDFLCSVFSIIQINLGLKIMAKEVKVL